MALTFGRRSSHRPAEALVLTEDFPAREALGAELDRVFGADGWTGTGGGNLDQALRGLDDETRLCLVAVGNGTPDALDTALTQIAAARSAGLTVVLIAGDALGTQQVHRLLRAGIADFAPYPEPAGALSETVDRMRLALSAASGTGPGGQAGPGRRPAIVASVYGVAGGVGASTIAVNLAWELARTTRRSGRRVVLLDFNFQYGSVATYLEVPRREAVHEVVTAAQGLDQTGFTQALSTFRDLLHVMTSPRDALPLDIVGPEDIASLLRIARESFDYVLIDLPQSLMGWSEQVYQVSDVFYTVMEPDMRSTQNMFRFLRTLKSEDLDLDRLAFLLNRAPGLTDLSGRARTRRLSDSLGISFGHMLPDGGRQVRHACDQGIPLGELARGNGFRREIARIAEKLAEHQPAQAPARPAATITAPLDSGA